MNNYFTGMTEDLNIQNQTKQINHSLLDSVVEDFENHESIHRIKLADSGIAILSTIVLQKRRIKKRSV